MEIEVLAARKNFVFSTGFETIEFQHNDSVTHILDNLFSKVRDRIMSSEPADKRKKEILEIKKNIEKAIEDRFKMKIDLDFFSKYAVESYASAFPNYISSFHTFINKAIKGKFEDLSYEPLDKLTDKNGTVDLSSAKLGGYFSEVVHYISFDIEASFKFLNKTPREAVSTLLHEIGHIFNGYSYMNRALSFNTVMTDITNKSKGNKKMDISIVFSKLKEFNKDLKEEDVQNMVNGSGVLAPYSWFKFLNDSNLLPKSHLMVSDYDNTSSEAQADSFATRIGYGKELVSALSKLNQGSKPEINSRKYSAGFRFMRIMGGVLYIALLNTVRLGLILYAGSSLMMAATTVPLLLLLSLMFIMILVTAAVGIFSEFRSTGTDMIEGRYDSIKIRYVRVRNDIISSLKNKDLDRKYVIEAITSIKEIDEIVKLYEDDEFNLLRPLVDKLFSMAGKAKKSYQDQRLLEDLANNELFLMASKFRTAV